MRADDFLKLFGKKHDHSRTQAVAWYDGDWELGFGLDEIMHNYGHLEVVYSLVTTQNELKISLHGDGSDSKRIITARDIHATQSERGLENNRYFLRRGELTRRVELKMQLSRCLDKKIERLEVNEAGGLNVFMIY
jgi:hypothetical protein